MTSDNWIALLGAIITLATALTTVPNIPAVVLTVAQIGAGVCGLILLYVFKVKAPIATAAKVAVAAEWAKAVKSK